jgi:hypothetical protein
MNHVHNTNKIIPKQMRRDALWTTRLDVYDPQDESTDCIGGVIGRLGDSSRRGYHVGSGITPPFPSTYWDLKLLHFFDHGFWDRGTDPIVKNNKIITHACVCACACICVCERACVCACVLACAHHKRAPRQQEMIETLFVLEIEDK